MFHPNTLQLIACWRDRRGERPAPARSDIQLADIGALAPWCFIALAEPDGDVRFRLAGEGIINLHGRLLVGESLPTLWRPSRRPLVTQALSIALSAAEPVVLTATARGGNGAEVGLEVLCAPLSGPDGRLDRFLGLYQPLAQRFEAPLEALDLAGVNGGLRERRPPELRLAAADGRRIP